MTPSLPDILIGQCAALAMPLPPEAEGDYAAGRLGLLVMLAALAAQEAERGVAARIWENQTLRALFAKAGQAYDGELDGRLGPAAAGVDHDLSWSALDRANADLRRLLIALHEAAEGRRDGALDRDILALYGRMAHERRLAFPAVMGG